jgi:2-hydroxymuconate-semialdehyde hydrolase
MREFELDFESHRIKCYEEGAGPALLLLHGIGPGTSITANFQPVIASLAKHYRLIGTDLVGFGGSSRKREAPFFDVQLWQRQAQFLADRLDTVALRVLGHSFGGALALKLAADNPRVIKVLASGANGGPVQVGAEIECFWTFPQSRADLRRAMSMMLYDASGITDELLDDRLRHLKTDDYEAYFSRMFAGSKQDLIDACMLPPGLLAKIQGDVLFVHGRDDRITPAVQTALLLSRFVARCDVVLLGQCGHAPPREHTGKFLSLALAHFGG